MKIIVGANGTTQPGWLSLERSQLDLRNREMWARFFHPGSVDAVLTEHARTLDDKIALCSIGVIIGVQIPEHFQNHPDTTSNHKH